MPSELDRALMAVMEGLTASGGPLEVVTAERGGHFYPAFKHAPPSLPAYFAHYCAQHADALFIVDGDLRLTFGQVHALACRAADGLIARHGVAPGDRVGLAARNSASWIVLYMAVLMAGGCATLLNGWWSAEELAGGVDLAGCKLVLADPARAARLEGHAHGARVVIFEHGEPEAGIPFMRQERGKDAALPEIGPEDLATILFTSGSTGLSKGAVSDHRGVVHGAMGSAAQALMLYTYLAGRGEAPHGQPAALVNVPLFHVTGEVPLLLQSFALGRKLVIMPKWDALLAMRLIEQERVSVFLGVPLMSHEIATHPRRGEFDLSSCATYLAAGAPRPVEHVARFREALPQGFPAIGYALTETNSAGCININENYLAKPGSAGPANRPLVELAVFAEDGERLPAGEAGEVAIRTIANFLGYWNNPEATKAAILPDGFFLTGDLGYVDEDGYLFIVDRKKDIIIRGGENIASLEVEQAIYAHPGVAEASVFGLPDAHYGEVPVAVWLAKPGHAVGEGELSRFVGERIAAFKVPVRHWQVHEALPRLGTEKVDKRALRARYSAAWESAKTGE